MNLIFYKSEKGNFGDDLNSWLWPQLFGEKILLENSDTAFLGIGSILMKNSFFIEKANTYKNKIVFGTGLRSIKEEISFDDSWNIMFLRGPYSSLKLTNSLNNYISDSAYCIGLLPNYNDLLKIPKKHKLSFIPYFKSIDKVNWEAICKQLGWNLILPTGNNVEGFINEIASSEQVISEAMHGAIIADVLRVPWKRLRFYSHIYEGEGVSEFKWNDWLLSVDITKNSYIDSPMKKKRNIYKILTFANKKRNEKRLINNVKNEGTIPFQLSSEERFQQIISELKAKQKELELLLSND